MRTQVFFVCFLSCCLPLCLFSLLWAIVPLPSLQNRAPSCSTRSDRTGPRDGARKCHAYAASFHPIIFRLCRSHCDFSSTMNRRDPDSSTRDKLFADADNGSSEKSYSERDWDRANPDRLDAIHSSNMSSLDRTLALSQEAQQTGADTLQTLQRQRGKAKQETLLLPCKIRSQCSHALIFWVPFCGVSLAQNSWRMYGKTCTKQTRIYQRLSLFCEE